MIETSGDRLIVVGALTLICAIAWTYLAYMGWGMAHMGIGATMAVMPQMTAWGPIDIALVFAMWSSCWLLMLLLFVLGVMNLIWIALLSAFVLIERILPNPLWFRTLAGCAFIGWGIALLM